MSYPHTGAFTVARHPQFLNITGHIPLHSIIIKIAHLRLLNTEHKERNVWKHFNLREVENNGSGRKAGL